MAYSVTDRWGGSDNELPKSEWTRILQALKEKDQEHPDAWLSHDSGWTLIVHYKGIVTFCNDDLAVEERHINTSDASKIIQLWEMLSVGDIAGLEKIDWLPGNGIPPQTPEERKEVEDGLMNFDREWYDKLGPEDNSTKCRKDGCVRGVVKFSVMCRVHHFEMIRKSKCPFSY